METNDYAKDPLLFYPARNLSEEERRRMDSLDIRISDLTVDHIVYSLSRQIENNFQSFYTVAEAVVGEEKALEIAREIGRRYGGLGYANFLKSIGMEGKGSPKTMALYEDLVHSIRGPKHAGALFAQYDDKRCIIKRKSCVYFNENCPQNGKYTGAFYEGCEQGYKSVDGNLKRLDIIRCRFQGAADCEQHLVYKD